MSMLFKTYLRRTALLLALGTAPLLALPLPSLARQTTANGLTTDTRPASDIPFLQDFLNLSPAERSQIDVYFMVKIKHGDPSLTRITLNDRGNSVPIHIGPDGRLSPMPTREQVNDGATLTVTYQEGAGIAFKSNTFSPLQPSTTYDARSLALGLRQGNNIVKKVAGVLSLAVPPLDRVFFVGGGSGTVEIDGKTVPLPQNQTKDKYPNGTPYFVPADMPGATRIHLSQTPKIAMFDNGK